MTVAEDARRAADGADLVLVAAPVGAIGDVFGAHRGEARANAVVTDGGSTKRDVVAAARAALGKQDRAVRARAPDRRGGEERRRRGDARRFSRPRAWSSRRCPRIAPEAVDARARGLGGLRRARHRMDAEEHDAVFAAVSHLPHLLAYALVHELAARDDAAQLFRFAGGGFRDFTRIASSHPEMWRDICVAEPRRRCSRSCDRYAGCAGAARRGCSSRRRRRAGELFAEARAARRAWTARNGG